MKVQADKTGTEKSKAVANSATAAVHEEAEAEVLFEDKRPEVVAQQQLAEKADSSPQAGKNAQLQAMANAASVEPIQLQDLKGDEDLLEDKPEAVQRVGKEEEIQTKSAVVQKKEKKPANNTGLPDTLKSGIEGLSGLSMDDVKVHYNSARPAQLQAHAFAQGTDIHMAPGQEKHLPHEAWHVVQQKQGRVKPTMQMKGKVGVNDDVGLEKEADLMGGKAFSQLNREINGNGDSVAGRHGSAKNLKKLTGIQDHRNPHPLSLSSRSFDRTNGAILQRKELLPRENCKGTEPGTKIGNSFKNIVDKWYQFALTSPDDEAFKGHSSGYVSLWYDYYANWVKEGSKWGDKWLSARFGYLVESLSSPEIESQSIADKELGTLKTVLQDVRGGTRPDIVVKDSKGADVAWYDITASDSAGHIWDKNSSLWRNIPYVAEITYNSLSKGIFKQNSPDPKVKKQAEKERKQREKDEGAWNVHIAALAKILNSNPVPATRAGRYKKDENALAKSKKWATTLEKMKIAFSSSVDASLDLKPKDIASILYILQKGNAPTNYGWDQKVDATKGKRFLSILMVRESDQDDVYSTFEKGWDSIPWPKPKMGDDQSEATTEMDLVDDNEETDLDEYEEQTESREGDVSRGRGGRNQPDRGRRRKRSRSPMKSSRDPSRDRRD